MQATLSEPSSLEWAELSGEDRIAFLQLKAQQCLLHPTATPAYPCHPTLKLQYSYTTQHAAKMPGYAYALRCEASHRVLWMAAVCAVRCRARDTCSQGRVPFRLAPLVPAIMVPFQAIAVHSLSDCQISSSTHPGGVIACDAARQCSQGVQPGGAINMWSALRGTPLLPPTSSLHYVEPQNVQGGVMGEAAPPSPNSQRSMPSMPSMPGLDRARSACEEPSEGWPPHSHLECTQVMHCGDGGV